MHFLRRFKRAKPPLRDYLYIDHRRLNSYLDQISSTTTYDKTLALRSGLSLTGPSVQIEYLDDNGQLGRRRPGLIQTDRDDIEMPDFVLEECDAVRVLIPPADGSEPERGVVVWLSLWPLTREEKAIRPPGPLCLIQDSTLEDTRHRAGFSHSGYTWLQALLLPASSTVQGDPASRLVSVISDWRLSSRSNGGATVSAKRDGVIASRPSRLAEGEGLSFVVCTTNCGIVPHSQCRE